jgi:hypothetical protein
MKANERVWIRTIEVVENQWELTKEKNNVIAKIQAIYSGSSQSGIKRIGAERFRRRCVKSQKE